MREGTNENIQIEKRGNGKTENLDFIKEKSQEIAPELIEMRRKIHENPELGFEEFKTAELVADKLKKIGLDEIETGIGKTGVIGILKGTRVGKTIALRADMDALKIQEDTNNEFASKNPGKMHACGHDAHTSALLGTAEILKELRNKQGLGGDVVFIFQPNEEKAIDPHSGSIDMIKHLYKKGVWQKVDAIFACHVQAGLPMGKVRLNKGLVLAGSSRFDLDVKAHGGHGAKPNEVASPVILGSKIVSKIDKEFNPQKPQGKPNEIVVNPTFIESEEPHSYNIVPRETKVGGTIRILREDDAKGARREVIQKVKDIAEKAVKPWKVMGAGYKFKFSPGTRPVVHRDKQLVEEAERVCKDIICDDVQFNRQPSPAGDDFSFYLENFQGRQIPGIYFFLGAANPEKGIPLCAHHNKKFKIDESIIPQMSALMAEMARRELLQPKEN